jgi:ribosome biogenesis protein MAK21
LVLLPDFTGEHILWHCRALYGMLLAPDLAKSNKSAMFLSLLYKAMKADISNNRILAFIKRLLQVRTDQRALYAMGKHSWYCET